MRILIVDTCYEPFLREHYADRPELAFAPYATQWRALMDRFFGTADSYSHYLALLGHTAHELVVNCAPLQAAWVSENASGLRRLRLRRQPPLDALDAQVADFRPDVLYVQDLSVLPRPRLERLRRHAPRIVGQVASRLPSDDRLGAYDLIVTSFPHFVERLESAGVPSAYLRIGFDPRVLEHVTLDRRAAARAVFVGGLGGSQHGHGNAVLESAAGELPIDFYGYGADTLPDGSPVRAAYKGEAWGLDMYRVLARSAVALNRHIDVAEGFANNMRLYEATGVGSLLLTDAGRNLSDLFEPGREVETYADEAELVEKLRHYLAAESEREAIAAAGQARTLRDHTYAARMRELEALLGDRLATP
jgi:hypothetical protein